MEDSLRKYFRKRIWRRRFYETALNKKGEQSLDLSCWSLDELKEFIKDNKTIIEDYEAEEEKNSNEINNNNSNVIFSLEKYCKENEEKENIDIIKEEYGKCLITEFTPFSKNENIKVKLSNH